jgi:hypothetical protein
LDRLSADPNWIPLFETETSDRVLHNLPLPEFDETGLVGRSKEAQTLLAMLETRRDNVVTVVGEGGLGKTALAVKVLYDLIDSQKCPYEIVLWTSLKTEQLTAEGIESLTDVVRDMSGMAESLLAAVDVEEQGSLRDLALLLEGVPSLVVIDNLETTNAEEVLKLYDALPRSTRFLFTSRVGIGQLERRFELFALSLHDASHFFRITAHRRQLTPLARLDQESVEKIVNRLRRSPLAIKWFVMSVPALGLRHQGQDDRSLRRP